jgi:hypothetical protein
MQVDNLRHLAEQILIQIKKIKIALQTMYDH